MATCISSLGHDHQHSFKKIDELIFKTDDAWYYEDLDDQLRNIHKRLKVSHTPISLKIVAGSFYKPKDYPEDHPKFQLGDDAHFIHEIYQTIGIADGVGGWAKIGIDAGKYAREFMKNSETAINNYEPKGHVNPKRVLEEAYKNTKFEGSSTACIITLRNNMLCAANVGDSGFFLVRKGKVVYESPIQQRCFGCPYQLGNCKDNPSVAQEIEILVEKDDILIGGTDGLLDNMNKSEIEDVVARGINEKLNPRKLAIKIGNLALYNSFDRFSEDTPYARAAKKAKVIRKGGKVDDITVVVAYIK